LRASLLQAFYSVRSERQLMEQIDYNLLFCWFVGLGIDDGVWDHSTVSKNRDRLLDADVAAKFLEAVLRHPNVKRFLSDDHFSVDGMLLEAWASFKELAHQGWSCPPKPPEEGPRREPQVADPPGNRSISHHFAIRSSQLNAKFNSLLDGLGHSAYGGIGHAAGFRLRCLDAA
jgi:hypothetical protein